jgi:hypothetical protein
MPSSSGLPAHQRLGWRYEPDADCIDSEESATRRWGILHSRLAKYASSRARTAPAAAATIALGRLVTSGITNAALKSPV